LIPFASSHEIDDSLTERAVWVVQTFDSRKVMLALLDHQVSAESVGQPGIMVFRRQPSDFRGFLGTARNQ
jgi:hypothetical protein